MVIVGIDEVGRGCWAGPLVASAVILGEPITGLKDSKKLSRSQREYLERIINTRALAVGIGSVEAIEIGQLGLTKATSLAMTRALELINIEFDQIIIDGNLNFLHHDPRSVAMVKADDLEPAVSAASIIAKVYRDNWMFEVAKKYPNYGFEKNVGYGTKLHIDSLEKYGPSPIHRMFYKPLLKYRIDPVNN